MLPLLVGALLVTFSLFHPAHAQGETSTSPLTDSVRQQIRTRIEAERQGLNALSAGSRPMHATRSVMQFYEQQEFIPAWLESDGPSPLVDSLLSALRRASRDGLNPKDYHVEAIVSLKRSEEPADDPDPMRLSDLDLLCTDAFLLYASHLLSGHVSATKVTPSWNIPHRRADLLQLLTEATETRSIADAFASVRPSQPEYQALMSALRRYRSIASEGGWPTLPDGPKLEVGSTGDRVTRLRNRLAATDRISPPDSTAATSEDEFDAALETAVVEFQKRHGLEADGIVGPATRAALNVPVQRRVEQLLVNLERWRWLPEDLGSRHILVNIAAAELQVVENGEETLSMRVVTGRPYRQTPVFSGEISYLVFNPYWHVPHSIATRDQLPEIKKDRGYLDRMRLKVFQGWGANAQPVDPSTVDWTTLSQSNFPYRIRQEPGPHNALGRIKFMFPNPHSVYLHDTPTRGLFARAQRNFSSGCIRLERPIELAEYLLADHPQWSPQQIQSVLKNPSNEQSVPLRTRVPVHLQYWTAWANVDDQIHFRDDVYQRDEAVLEALNAAPPRD